jgi:hypothetical protein
MRALLLVASESAAVDAASNRLSLFHVMEELSSPVFPAAVPMMMIVGLLSRTQEEPSHFDLHVRATMEGRQDVMFDVPIAAEFQNRPRYRFVAQIAGVVLPGPGTVRIHLMQNEDVLALWETQIAQIGQPQIVSAVQSPQAAPAVPEARPEV